MFCPNCGAQLPDDATFCTNCGATVRRATPRADSRMPQPVPSPPQEGYSDNAAYENGARQPRRHGWTIPVVAIVCIVVVALVGLAVFRTLNGEPLLPFFDNVAVVTNGSNVQGNTSGGSGSENENKSSGTSDSVDETVSTSVANLVNGGYVCEDDDYVYYTTPVAAANGWYTNAIVRADKGGSGEQTIYSTGSDGSVVFHLNAVGDRIIFSEVQDSSTTVRSVHIDGSDPQTLAQADDSSLVQVYKGRVYYLSDGTIRVMDPDGGNESDVVSVGTRLWRVANDRILYFDYSGATSVSMCDLDGSDAHTFITAESSYVDAGECITNVIPTTSGTYDVMYGLASEGGAYIVEEYSADGSSNFVAEANGGSYILRINPTSIGLVVVSDVPVEFPYFGDGEVPMIQEINCVSNMLYQTSEGSGANLRSPACIDGYLYFGYESPGANRLVRVSLSGGSAEDVA